MSDVAIFSDGIIFCMIYFFAFTFASFHPKTEKKMNLDTLLFTQRQFGVTPRVSGAITKNENTIALLNCDIAKRGHQFSSDILY